MKMLITDERVTTNAMHMPHGGGARISLIESQLQWKLNNQLSTTLITFTNIIPPGGGIPLDIHNNEDESIYLLQGNLIFKLGDDVFEVEQGGPVYVPKGKPHGLRSVGEKDAQILFMLDLSPQSRYEEMFNALVGLGPTDFDQVKAVCIRNNVEFLTPQHLP